MQKIKPTDNSLVRRIKNYNCSNSIVELKDRHAGLVVNIYGKYGGVLSAMNFSPSEFHSEIHYIIYEAAKKFDLKRKDIKFSTYLGNLTRYYCLDKITELTKDKTVQAEPEDITKIIDSCYNSNDTKESKEKCDYIFSILNQMKDDRIIKIFNYRYFDGNHKMTWKEVGKEVGLTNQSCLNLHNKAIKFLREKIKSDNLYDKV